MVIFFTKYVVGVMLARHLAIVTEPVFVVLVSLCYGFFSGLFLARAMVIARSSVSGTISAAAPR